MKINLLLIVSLLFQINISNSQIDTLSLRLNAGNLVRNYYANLDNIHSVLNNKPEDKNNSINHILRNIFLNEDILLFNDILKMNNSATLSGKKYLELYSNLFFEEAIEHKIKFIPGQHKFNGDKPDTYIISFNLIDSIFLMNLDSKEKVISRIDSITHVITFILNSSKTLVPRISEIRKYIKDDYTNPIDSQPLSPNSGTPMEVNFPPIAKIKLSGSQTTITLDQLPLILNSESVDPEMGIMTYQWSIIRGQGGTLESPTLPNTRVINLNEGSYTFKLDITDSKGISNSETIDVMVISRSQPISPGNPTESPKPSDKIQSLKGGPEYALLNLVFPGIGHFYTSGDYTGFGKKKYHFFTTIAVGTLLASSFYLKLDSERDYSTYKSLVIEYQKNDLGMLTSGQRGGVESEALKFYDRAKLKDQLFKGILIASGSVALGDTILTLFKGLINKSEYNRRYKLGKYSFFIDPISKQYIGSVRYNFNP